MPETHGLSVFLPAYNEAENIAAAVSRALEVLPGVTENHEVIVVDDGSTDGTDTVVEELVRRHPGRVRLVRHGRNRGYGAALRTGFEAARLRYVFFSDADGQFDLGELGAFIRPLLDGSADAVIGYRNRRADPLGRRLLGLCWSTMVRGLLGVSARDVNCAFKGMASALARSLALESQGACASAEMLAKLEAIGVRVRECGVTHRPRLRGKATGGSLAVAWRALRDLAALRRPVARFRADPKSRVQ